MLDVEAVVLGGFADQPNSGGAHLPCAGNTGPHRHSFGYERWIERRSQGWHLWARSDEAHPTGYEQPELREFVEMRLSEEATKKI
jgi:hypothetical protein